MHRLIECLVGSVTPDVGGTTYVFEKDEHGRFVSKVYDLVHVQCFLASTRYREAHAIVVLDDQSTLQLPDGYDDETGDDQTEKTGTEEILATTAFTGAMSQSENADETITDTSNLETGLTGQQAAAETGTGADAAGNTSTEKTDDATEELTETVTIPVVVPDAAVEKADASEAPAKRAYKPRAKKTDADAAQDK